MKFDSIIIFLIIATYGSYYVVLPCPRECPYCDVEISSTYHYILHVNNAHSDNEISTCPECHEKFEAGSVLELHIIQNHAENDKLELIKQIEYDHMVSVMTQIQINKEAEQLQKEEINNKMLESPTIENITELILSHLINNIAEEKHVYLASSMDFYGSAREDIKYGCSYRCMQMLLSSIMLNVDFKTHLTSMWINLHKMSISRTRMPNVSMLWRHLEECWNMGIDPNGKKETYDTSESKNKSPNKLGASIDDVNSVFLGLGIKFEYKLFDRNTNRNNYQEMLNWLYLHFININNLKYISPVYLSFKKSNEKKPGHATIAIGVEVDKNNTIIPLVLCPNENYTKLQTKHGEKALKYIRSPSFLRKRTLYRVGIIMGIDATLI
ncbi:zinc finger-containing ubiquitin peptidase 1-like [Daktulosphaira vitifoliae]|uniref:zinc finger-containing ubiquitin peptidase 1-like n=1 Tax=Daktulosphaira vitifoliae TaxID=58002 RepID=UPI0021AAB258|nr:zinc finger-containing ubiquitin peptidase 1-like [Daktulosphaira vitifoliae]XP_050531095.1 zinc finger-containing ubiquitin peptidase 1-like [Daktulosphaira vitifoliae]